MGKNSTVEFFLQCAPYLSLLLDFVNLPCLFALLCKPKLLDPVQCEVVHMHRHIHKVYVYVNMQIICVTLKFMSILKI